MHPMVDDGFGGIKRKGVIVRGVGHLHCCRQLRYDDCVGVPGTLFPGHSVYDYILLPCNLFLF